MMTLDKWIALCACLAAFVSAIAALMAVKQASLQRKLSYKPQILLRPQFFDYEFDNYKLNILDRVSFRDAKNDNIFKSDLAVNIGLGAALEVKISWHYDSQEVIEYLNSCFAKLEKPIRLHKYANGISVDRTDGNKDGVWYTNNNNDFIDYILSFSQKPTPTEIKFPSSLISLTCACLIFSLRADGLMLKSLPKSFVRFEYKDIGGEKFIDEYHINIDFHFSQDGPYTTKMVGYLSFDKKMAMNKTVKGLQRIRKSYADFMDEHNFNKNR